MAEQPKLLGTLPSPFVHRVIWALKLKAIPYEFIIEEDLTNKSPLLLKYNPVHKKVPVFLHGDKPVCESMIIVEYIDEVWPQNPLLPKDPYERAQARFWVKFAEDKGTAVFRMFSSKGEELEKTKKETLEMLQTVEEHGIGEKKFFGGESIGVADIAFGSVVYGLEIIEEAIGEGAVFEDEGRAEMSERYEVLSPLHFRLSSVWDALSNEILFYSLRHRL
ncbi:hypothetical protein DKX38_028883 [Salix brachista]|uniref:glutathione transferase n=1 Tax=Salix brachista TaxID=2182728 RepID=A0A5N5J2L6_9ROSI|nr:hypothetical protein DKX38_028883 [Salix brachista]